MCGGGGARGTVVDVLEELAMDDTLGSVVVVLLLAHPHLPAMVGALYII